MTLTARDYKNFLGFYALALAVQMLGKHFTDMSVADWYPTLEKSSLTPPGIWFGIVWTALYILMAAAAARVQHVIGILNSRPLRWWLIQLFAGLLWSMVFFGHREIGYGFGVILFTLFASLVTFHHFHKVNHIAGWMLLPQLLWLAFATYLNLYIVLHN